MLNVIFCGQLYICVHIKILRESLNKPRRRFLAEVKYGPLLCSNGVQDKTHTVMLSSSLMRVPERLRPVHLWIHVATMIVLYEQLYIFYIVHVQ